MHPISGNLNVEEQEPAIRRKTRHTNTFNLTLSAPQLGSYAASVLRTTAGMHRDIRSSAGLIA